MVKNKKIACIFAINRNIVVEYALLKLSLKSSPGHFHYFWSISSRNMRNPAKVVNLDHLYIEEEEEEEKTKTLEE